MECYLKGYYNKVLKEVNTGERVNKAAAEGVNDREARKFSLKSNWYRPKYDMIYELDNTTSTMTPLEKEEEAKGRKVMKNQKQTNNINDQIESVLFVPSTPKSKICKQHQ